MISIALAVYRLPMLVVAGVFVMYVFFGHAEWLPSAISGRASYGKAMWHFWMQTEGIVRRSARRVGNDLPVRAVRRSAAEGEGA
ncbi:MAG: hypothetical protein R3D43_13000 [Tepidamorphaceae bacterium]